LSAGTYLVIYLFVVSVALVTSGRELFREPRMWYAFLAPVSYAAFCLLYAAGAIGPALSKPIVILVHAAVLPALIVSFMFLGFGLPVLALIWWRTYRASLANLPTAA
jgi:energy-converting hydrogenase Eha subunit E